jgi:hypothetical protein
VRQQLLAAIYAGQPFRTVLRDSASLLIRYGAHSNRRGVVGGTRESPNSYPAGAIWNTGRMPPIYVDACAVSAGNISGRRLVPAVAEVRHTLVRAQSG